MITLLVAVQVSLFGARLHREEEPPEVRAAEHLVLLHRELEPPAPKGARTLEQALALAADLRALIEAGASFEEALGQRSEAQEGARADVLGSFVPGVLEPPLDRFLFAAETAALSPPLDAPSGVHLLRRVPARVGVRQILIDQRGDAGRVQAEELLAQLRDGAGFDALAAEHSGDPVSRGHAGAYSIFERGPRDSLLKRAAFEAELGQLIGPLESPLGWHVLQAVDPSEIPATLAPTRFIRLRALLIAHDSSPEPLRFEGRSEEAARALALDLHARIQAGESMQELARRWNDDPGGRERGGDVGWVHRGTPGLPFWMLGVWRQPVGWLSEVIVTPAGFVLLRRDL